VVIAAGTLDSLGNICFVLASKYGRLDWLRFCLRSTPRHRTAGLAASEEQITRLQTAGMTAALIAVP